MKATLALALTLVALACARSAQLRMPQVEDSSLVEQQGTLGAEVLRFHVGMQIELLEAGLRLRRAGRELCEEQLAPILGILAWRRNDLRLRQLKELGESELKLGDDPRVLFVHPDSAAARAGVRVGDLLRRFNGERLTRSEQLWKLPREAGPGPFELEIERAGSVELLPVERELGCRHQVVLAESDQIAVQPTRDGNIVVSQAMVRFARGSDELAAAIAHQMAHVILELDRELPGASDYPDQPLAWERVHVRRELAADLLALRLMHAAGFDPAALATLTDRLGIEHPWTLTLWAGGERGPGHPYVPARLLAIRDALAGDPASERGPEPGSGQASR